MGIRWLQRLGFRTSLEEGSPSASDTRPSCMTCQPFRTAVTIDTPEKLRTTLRWLGEARQRGTLHYLGRGQMGDPFSTIEKGDCWGDFVSNYFSCPQCGQIFHLHAETYHGSGGAFLTVNHPDELIINE